jgi:hypothetical protein
MQEAEDTKALLGRVSAVLAGFGFGLLSLFGCLAGADRIGEVTHSGLLGICGPYGNHVGLVVLLYLASFPVSAMAGVWFGKTVLRRIKRGDTTNSTKQSND